MSNATREVDAEASQRIRAEWAKIKEVLRGSAATAVDDPLGQDGLVTVKLNSFRQTGAGEVILLKGNPPGDHRYTRFRTWGASGSDFVEKSSYLVRADGHREFHKRCAEPGDSVLTAHEIGDDDGWVQSFA